MGPSSGADKEKNMDLSIEVEIASLPHFHPIPLLHKNFVYCLLNRETGDDLIHFLHLRTNLQTRNRA
jgi:hypothetical protein